MGRGKNRWTPEEVEVFFEFVRSGKKDKEIAEILGRNRQAIADKRMQLRNKGLYPIDLEMNS